MTQDEKAMEGKPRLDVSRTSCPSPHGLANRFTRGLWAVAWLLLFRPSPRVLRGWRRMLLRAFGARIGRGVKVMASARIWAPWNLAMADESSLGEHCDCYNVARVTIGAHATVSRFAQLCTAGHDVADPHMGLISAPIEVGTSAWIGQGAFVRMGVRVGEGAVVGSHAVLTRDAPPWTVLVGNPARVLKRRELRA